MEKMILFLGKRFFVFVLVVMMSVICFGQKYSIKGNIFREGHIPVNKVTIKLKGYNKLVLTDSLGNFCINNMPTKNVTLIISSVGFKTVEYGAKADVNNVICLKSDEKMLKEVEILEYKTLNTLKNPDAQPAPLQLTVQNIGSEQIQNIGAINAIEALKYSISTNLTEQGRKRRNFVSMRGQSSVEYAIDGISMYEFSDITNALSSSIVDEIEVTRSSNTLTMGYSGLNGVVNFKTKSFDRNTTLGEIEYGTFNKFHASITNGGKIFTGLSYVLSVSKDKTDGPSGRNAAEDMLNIYGKVNYKYGDKFEASVQHFYMYGMREFAQAQNDKVDVAPKNLAMIWKYDPLKFNVTTGILKYHEGKNATTELQMYYVDSHRSWVERAYNVSKGKVMRDSIPPYSTVQEPYTVFGGGIFQSLSLIKNNILRLSLMGSRNRTPYSMTNMGANISTNSDIRSFAGTILDEHNFDKISINGGVKIMRDYYKKYAPGSSSIYIEDKWQPFTVNANVGATWRPSSSLLFTCIVSGGVINAPKENLVQIISGNDTTQSIAKNEKRLNIDLGVKKTIPNLGDITITGFFMNRKSAYDYTGILYDNADGSQSEYIENVNLKSYGVDIIWNSPKYFGMLYSNINATFMRTDQTENGVTSRYNQIPQTIINWMLGATKYGLSLDLYGKYISRYVGDRFVMKKTPDEVDYVGDFINVDASLSYAIPKTHFSVYGRVINIGDVRYCTISPVYPDYGRQFSIGVRAKF